MRCELISSIVACPPVKQIAKERRKDETSAKRKAAEALKERRKRRRPEATKGGKANEKGGQDGAFQNESKGTDDDGEDDDDIDLLPDDVLDAIVHDELADRRLMERRVVSERLRAHSPPKQQRKFSSRQVGPVTVQVLKSGPDRKPSGEDGCVK